jgi:hypothetical protein
MKEETKIIVAREIIVASGFILIWLLATLSIAMFAAGFSQKVVYNLSFYFILLYGFYIFDRVVIWALEKYFMINKKDKKNKKDKVFDSAALIFIGASALGYFLILLWYHYVLPGKQM